MEIEKVGKPVWGIVSTETVYHAFEDCREIVEKRRRVAINNPKRYESAEEALKAGHQRLCDECKRGRLVEYGEGLFMRLTVEQIDTLKAIGNVYAKTKAPLTLAQIATARNRKASTCFVLVKHLVDKGLVSKRYGKHGKKAVNSCIVPTALAARVLEKIA